jgi:hypothetical protein
MVVFKLDFFHLLLVMKGICFKLLLMALEGQKSLVQQQRVLIESYKLVAIHS